MKLNKKLLKEELQMVERDISIIEYSGKEEGDDYSFNEIVVIMLKDNSFVCIARDLESKNCNPVHGGYSPSYLFSNGYAITLIARDLDGTIDTIEKILESFEKTQKYEDPIIYIHSPSTCDSVVISVEEE